MCVCMCIYVCVNEYKGWRYVPKHVGNLNRQPGVRLKVSKMATPFLYCSIRNTITINMSPSRQMNKSFTMVTSM